MLVLFFFWGGEGGSPPHPPRLFCFRGLGTKFQASGAAVANHSLQGQDVAKPGHRTRAVHHWEVQESWNTMASAPEPR